ncbi:hypothetical protein CYY_002469 [Polysphondylium violaceum]|uniref:Phosphoinositide phospholipase C n=1 Tax=Polysphondylium violaceum TaxID=133409 RepID=A0A8J4V2P9_9MYCE|nr:hypothetical protein CYY_002469 [Polysphondylium violaceum]
MEPAFLDASQASLSSHALELETLIKDELYYNSQSFSKQLLLDCADLDDFDHTKIIEIDSQKYKDGVFIMKISSKGKSQKKKLIFDLVKNILTCGKKKKVSFSEIDEIRIGHKTNIFNSYKTKSKDDESHLASFSILFSGNIRTSMDFICSSVPERREIVSFLYQLINTSKNCDNEYNFVKKEWDAIGKDTIDFSTLKKILARLNYSTSDHILISLMKFSDTNSDCKLDFTEFSNLLKTLRGRPELKPLFYRYSSHHREEISINKMKEFFKKEQDEDWTDDMCHDLIAKYNIEKLGHISFDNLEEYLCSNSNLLAKPECSTVYQTTHLPLTYYYINSSHNTYLSGHQLKGLSTSEMYTWSLRSGCKCVELDVWDGSDGDPIIFHGGTLTSQIKFSHVLETIKARGFEISPFPVILSLEVHASVPQQIAMANHLVQIFGDMLLAPLDYDLAQWPTLEQCKNKIILKGHVNKHNGSSISTTSSSSDEDDDYLRSSNDGGSSSSGLSLSSISLGGSSSETKKKTKAKIAEQLECLISLVSEGYKSPAKTMELPVWMIHSFAEEKVKAVQSEAEAMIAVNHNHFIRVYPRGTRFSSSNFDPVPGWNIGCQLAALNQQTSSEPMWLNSGLFEDNGSCGFVLKPSCLLPEHSEGFNPNAAVRHPLSKYSKLVVHVISARQLPKYSKTTKGEVIDPYVTLSIKGSPLDQKEVRTKVIDNNGLNPYWGEEFEFPLVHSQLAILLVRIDDKDKVGHNRIGHYSIRVENMRQGYRIIQLRNNFNRTIPLSNLLCKFTLVE